MGRRGSDRVGMVGSEPLTHANRQFDTSLTH